MSRYNDNCELLERQINEYNTAARATGKRINFKYGVYGVGETKMSFNACTFATRDEADRAGFELQMRWMGMEGFDTIETNDPVNYTFPHCAYRPIPV